MKFKDTEIKEPILKAVADLDFGEMTSIQEVVIPQALRGRDIVGQAPTGSGKTAAFSIPLVQNANHSKGVEALVLAPTRELAIQISKDIEDMSKYVELNIATVYGGASINEQVKEIKNSRIVVGTPGRVLDHLRRRTLNLRGIKTLVLDEADRMLDMGFIKDIEAIIRKTPRKRQTLLFSATIPRNFGVK